MPLTEEQHKKHMRRAIALSRQSGVVDKCGGCFGALVVDAETGEVVGEGRNKVLSECDPSWCVQLLGGAGASCAGVCSRGGARCQRCQRAGRRRLLPPALPTPRCFP